MVNAIPLLIGVAFIGGWIYLLKYVFTKAREQNAEGEEFRTGKPPAWRIVLYCLIAIAIPVYFTYPDLKKLQPAIKVLLGFVILILNGIYNFYRRCLAGVCKEKENVVGGT